MDDMKLKEGIYKKNEKSQEEKYDTFSGKGTILVLILNEPDNFWLTSRYPPGNRIKIGQTFKLFKTQKRDIFKIENTEKNLFLEVYKDRIEIRSEKNLI